MGSAPSKAAGQEEGFIFQNSTVPIRFSDPLVTKLESNMTSESDRERHIEEQVQARVAIELQKLRDAESLALAQTTYELSKQNIASESNNDLNSVILAADLDELKKKLARRTPARELKDVEQKKERVISCLREKKGRPLDCKAQVDDFKASVRELQTGFISRYQ